MLNGVSGLNAYQIGAFEMKRVENDCAMPPFICMHMVLRRLTETVFINIYFWYFGLQEFIQIPGIYFLHENVFYFLKVNYDVKR